MELLGGSKETTIQITSHILANHLEKLGDCLQMISSVET